MPRRVSLSLLANLSTTNTRLRGGVRGIVELEVLKAIERALGGNLRIQSFFDLIIGTRYVTLCGIANIVSDII